MHDPATLEREDDEHEHGGLGDLHAELQELAVDPWRAPERNASRNCWAVQAAVG
jgi:hypothetical protein